jgi:integrase/recombinase XerD
MLQPESITLKQAVDRFLLDCSARGLSPRTRSRYRYELGKLLDFLPDQPSPGQVTVDQLRAFFSDLQARTDSRQTTKALANRSKLSPFSISGVYRSVRTLFRWYLAEGLLDSNPMQRVRAPQTPQRVVNRLDESQAIELLRLLQSTWDPERNTALVLLMLDSGLRRGEVLGLTLEDVTRWLDFVFVRNGKGGKQRFVPVSECTREAIGCYLAVRPSGETAALFLLADGRPLTIHAVRGLFSRIRKHLGIARLYPHLLRHSFASLFLKNGGDLKSLSEELGHSRESTTADIYVHLNPDDLAVIHRRAAPFGGDRAKQLHMRE